MQIQKVLNQPKQRVLIELSKLQVQLIDILLELNHGQKMVFENQYHTVPTSNAVNKTLRECLSQLNIKRKNFHFHSLRHSHVAFLLSQGIDLYVISQRLGHSDMTNYCENLCILNR